MSLLGLSKAKISLVWLISFFKKIFQSWKVHELKYRRQRIDHVCSWRWPVNFKDVSLSMGEKNNFWSLLHFYCNTESDHWLNRRAALVKGSSSTSTSQTMWANFSQSRASKIDIYMTSYPPIVPFSSCGETSIRRRFVVSSKRLYIRISRLIIKREYMWYGLTIKIYKWRAKSLSTTPLLNVIIHM